MNTEDRKGRQLASMFVMGAALAVAGTAAVLWLLDMIRAPVGIFAGASAVLVILAAGWHAKKAS